MANPELPKVVAFPNRLSDQPTPPYGGGGGGGVGGMLEAKVVRLEDDMKEVKADLKSIRERLARLEGEVSRLPGYPGIAAIVGIIVALATAAQIVLPRLPAP